MNTIAKRRAMAEQFRRWRLDPVDYVRKMIRVEPEPDQIAILEALAKPGSKVAVKAGHGVGKTTTAAFSVLWFVPLFMDCKAVATAPSAPQLRDVLMAEIGKWHAQMHPWMKQMLILDSTRMRVRGKEETQFFTARTARPPSYDALQGIHATHVLLLLEEMFGLAEKVFEVGRGALSTPGARALGIGNPTATTGYAYRIFHKNRDLWQRFTLSCLTSKLASKQYVEEMAQEYGADSDIYRVRVLGEFPRSMINQLIARELADAASLRKLHPQQYAFAPKILGVDPAWEGDDRSAVVMRQGLQATKLGVFSRMDNMELGSRIHEWWSEHKCDACFIDIGWGAGVIDFLRSVGRNPIPVNFGGSSMKPEYANKRTEIWFEMMRWLELGGSTWNDEGLIEDLVGPQYFFQTNGKKMLERKRDMKLRGLKSPDIADALALTFTAPFVPTIYSPSGVPISSHKTEFARMEYDVLA